MEPDVLTLLLTADSSRIVFRGNTTLFLLSQNSIPLRWDRMESTVILHQNLIGHPDLMILGAGRHIISIVHIIKDSLHQLITSGRVQIATPE